LLDWSLRQACWRPCCRLCAHAVFRSSTGSRHGYEVRIMKFAISMIFGALMLTCISATGPVAWAAGDRIAQATPPDSGFRIGDTLPPVKRAPSGDYEDIGWDSLLPEGWSVEKEMESLNLNNLGDNDPKAREALKKIREMWDKAPANLKLDKR